MSYYQGSCRLYFLPYSNDMFVGNVNTGNLYDGLALTGDLADKVANNLQEGQEAALGHGFGTITDLQVGPDGYLYVLSYTGGSIYKIVPSSSLSGP